MNPTYREIWTNNGWAEFWYRNSGQLKHGQKWYQIRSVIRTAIWFPLSAYTFSALIIGWASLL